MMLSGPNVWSIWTKLLPREITPSTKENVMRRFPCASACSSRLLKISKLIFIRTSKSHAVHSIRNLEITSLTTSIAMPVRIRSSWKTGPSTWSEKRCRKGFINRELSTTRSWTNARTCSPCLALSAPLTPLGHSTSPKANPTPSWIIRVSSKTCTKTTLLGRSSLPSSRGYSMTPIKNSSALKLNWEWKSRTRTYPKMPWKRGEG